MLNAHQGMRHTGRGCELQQQARVKTYVSITYSSISRFSTAEAQRSTLPGDHAMPEPLCKQDTISSLELFLASGAASVQMSGTAF